jgi:hypothetical protein
MIDSRASVTGIGLEIVNYFFGNCGKRLAKVGAKCYIFLSGEYKAAGSGNIEEFSGSLKIKIWKK